MVFSGLDPGEKDAFFALLDEYFSSRPDLLHGSNPASTSEKAAASAVHSAFAEAPALWKKANTPGPGNSSPSNADIRSSAGGIAARAAAFMSSPSSQPIQGTKPTAPPRPQIGRMSSNSSDPDSPSSNSQRVKSGMSSASKMLSQRNYGDVDMSSGKNMFSSLRNSTANKTAPQSEPVVPPTFTKKNTFGPPPVRRVPSSASASTEATSPPPPPPPRAKPEPEEPEGEWAEVLYDYSSEDPGDLPLEENDRVLIVDKPSDDWWTGEKDGRRGLVPAAYIKLL